MRKFIVLIEKLSIVVLVHAHLRELVLYIPGMRLLSTGLTQYQAT